MFHLKKFKLLVMWVDLNYPLKTDKLSLVVNANYICNEIMCFTWVQLEFNVKEERDLRLFKDHDVVQISFPLRV